MCGILGTLPPADPMVFETALKTLTPRGPDGYGIKIIPDQIMLGHRRLAIVDLSSGGYQPMHASGKRYWIVFNGEIYNYPELRQELVGKGVSFHSQSDTEVLLKAYLIWGKDCLLKFNGMWALAIWDTHTQELFLSRDRFGKKPLFYARIGNRFVFASEMKAMFPYLNQIQPSPDFHWMHAHIMEYESTDKCLIAGIKRFPAGHYGIYRNGKLTFHRYWNTLTHLPDIPRQYEDQVMQFRSLFIDACKLRMRSDVSMGTALSGGLDSSSVLATMEEISRDRPEYSNPDWQHAFAAAFPGTPLDETFYAKRMARHVGLEPTLVTIDPRLEWDRLFDHLYQFEELYLTSPIPMIMTYRAVKAHGITVTLDGHGADELFSGYGHILEALLDAFPCFSEIKDILKIYQGTRQGFSQLKKQSDVEIATKFLIKKFLRTFSGREERSQDFNHPAYRKLDHLTRTLYRVFHETTLPTLLRNYDRYSMANGVEIRMPFLDHRIVRFVTALPYTSKNGKGYTKKLIRDALSPWLPDEIVWRKAKIGFNTPILNWMQNELKDWFGDLVHSQDFLESDLIQDSKALQRETLDILSGRKNSFLFAERVWTKLTPVLWEKAVIKRARK